VGGIFGICKFTFICLEADNQCCQVGDSEPWVLVTVLMMMISEVTSKVVFQLPKPKQSQMEVMCD